MSFALKQGHLIPDFDINFYEMDNATFLEKLSNGVEKEVCEVLSLGSTTNSVIADPSTTDLSHTLVITEKSITTDYLEQSSNNSWNHTFIHDSSDCSTLTEVEKCTLLYDQKSGKSQKGRQYTEDSTNSVIKHPSTITHGSFSCSTLNEDEKYLLLYEEQWERVNLLLIILSCIWSFVIFALVVGIAIITIKKQPLILEANTSNIKSKYFLALIWI